MDQIALELYTLKKNVLVFSKPQIFEKQIETFSSSPDRAQLGQLEESKEGVGGNGAGSEGDMRKFLQLEPSHKQGCRGQLCV